MFDVTGQRETLEEGAEILRWCSKRGSDPGVLVFCSRRKYWKNEN
jgi:hypothetical protein